LGLFSQEGGEGSRQDVITGVEDKELINKLIEILIEVRKQARRDKNWKLADQIRDQLARLNIILKDHPGGETSWEKKI
jgi:cysteinyl-tRNA synthetase